MKVVRELLVRAFKNLTLKTLVGLCVAGGAVAILSTLIVNPKALHPRENPNIALVIGLWIREFTGLIHHYYKRGDDSGKEGERQ